MGSRKPKGCIPVRDATSHSAPASAYPSPRAKQNSGNDCRRVLMNLSRPSRATAAATMSHSHTNAPAGCPSFKKKLAVVRAAAGNKKLRTTNTFTCERRLACAGTRFKPRGTITQGARRNNRSKMLSRKKLRKTPARRMSQAAPPTTAILTPDGKKVWPVRMAETHIPGPSEAAP